MSQQPQLQRLHERTSGWQWPLDLASYDRTPTLSHVEQQALDQFVALYEHVIPSPSKCLEFLGGTLSRLLRPIRDTLTVTGANVHACNLTGWFLFRQMHCRRAAFWAWNDTEWIEILCPSSALFGHQHHVNNTYCRPYALAVAYLLCNFTPGMALGTLHYHSFAIKVFGKPLVEQAVKRVSDPLLQWGHGTDVVISLPNELSKLLVWNHSPQVEETKFFALVAFSEQIIKVPGVGFQRLGHWGNSDSLRHLTCLLSPHFTTSRPLSTNYRYVAEEELEEQRPRRIHWFVYLGIFFMAVVAFSFALISVGNWWTGVQEDWQFGKNPRTFQIDTVVGHGDSQTSPTHFIALNLDGQIVVLEVSRNDPTKARRYDITTIQNNEGNPPVRLSFQDVNADGRPDMLVQIGDPSSGTAFTIILLNDGTQFVSKLNK